MFKKINTNLFITLVIIGVIGMTCLFLHAQKQKTGFSVASPTAEFIPECPADQFYSTVAGGCVTLADFPVHPYGCDNVADTLQHWSGCSELALDPVTQVSDLVCLLDERDGHTYRVRRFADGHCWLLDDLRYGDGCAKTTYDGRTGTDFTNNLSIDTFGDCRDGDTPFTIKDDNKHGYYYNYQAAVQAPQAALGQTYEPPTTPRGICPAGWHLPSGGSGGEYQQLADQYTEEGISFWRDSWYATFAGDTTFAGDLYGQGLFAYYWSATPAGNQKAYNLQLDPASVDVLSTHDRDIGFPIRCLQD